MNSVFLAFKSNKSSDSKSKSGNTLHGTGGTNHGNGGISNQNKKINQELTSYENLRHLREIGSSSNMSSLVDDEDLNVTPLKLGKRCPTPIQPIQPSFTLLDGHDVVDFSGKTYTEPISKTEVIDGQLKRSKKNTKCSLPPQPPIPTSKTDLQSSSNSSRTQIVNSNDAITSSDKCLSNKINNQINGDSSSRYTSCISSSIDKNLSSCSNVSSTRLNRPRLSLSGLGTNNVMPSVHGRNGTTTNGSSTGNATGTHKTRLSTHQRNLSLDFR